MSFSIRPYHLSDIIALYHVCLATGNSGQDASHLHRDHELLGHIYVAPYLAYEPELAFVLCQDGSPVGYVLGTRDSAGFAARCEREWFPLLRSRYSPPDPADDSADARAIRKIHRTPEAYPELAAYPAHLHIDLLPIAQGQGWGRRMMETFLDELRRQKVPAVYLGVGRSNTRAIGFYERMGFQPLPSREEWSWIVYGMSL
jgi:ribosomal protein S18 acetylase RimI-like enzyme